MYHPHYCYHHYCYHHYYHHHHYHHPHYTTSTAGELQTILCLVFGAGDTVYSGTLSGDIYQWKGNTLVNVIKAHNVSYHTLWCAKLS